jgi:hypothetical protein
MQKGRGCILVLLLDTREFKSRWKANFIYKIWLELYINNCPTFKSMTKVNLYLPQVIASNQVVEDAKTQQSL